MTKSRPVRFHSLIEFFRKLGAAVQQMRGKTPVRTARPRPAPFCTVCGDRTRPYDPDDEARHRHDRQS